MLPKNDWIEIKKKNISRLLSEFSLVISTTDAINTKILLKITYVIIFFFFGKQNLPFLNIDTIIKKGTSASNIQSKINNKFDSGIKPKT